MEQETSFLLSNSWTSHVVNEVDHHDDAVMLSHSEEKSVLDAQVTSTTAVKSLASANEGEQETEETSSSCSTSCSTSASSSLVSSIQQQAEKQQNGSSNKSKKSQAGGADSSPKVRRSPNKKPKQPKLLKKSQGDEDEKNKKKPKGIRKKNKTDNKTSEKQEDQLFLHEYPSSSAVDVGVFLENSRRSKDEEADQMSHPIESKYQTLTPVPPLLPVVVNPGQQPQHLQHHGYPGPPNAPPNGHPGGHVYAFSGHHAPPFVQGGHYAPSMPSSYEPLPKHIKLEADSSSSIPLSENSFQVPSVSSSTTVRPPGIHPSLGGHPVLTSHLMHQHPQQHGQHAPSAQLTPNPAQNHIPPQHHQQQQQPHMTIVRPNSNGSQHPQVNHQQLPPHLIHAPSMTTKALPPQDQWDHQTQGSLSPGGDSNNGNEKSGKKKRKRCGDCPGCLKKDNCGLCGPCKSVRSHQICKMRKCDQLKTKKEKAREVRSAQMAAAAASGINSSSKDNSGRDAVSPSSFRKTPNVVSNGFEDNSVVHRPPPVLQNGTNSLSGQNTAPNFAEFNNNGSSEAYATPFNGHHKPDTNGNPTEDPANRHQLANNRLKNLIQSRQGSKGSIPDSPHSDVNRNPEAPGPPRVASNPTPVVSYQDYKQGDVGVAYRPQSSPNTRPPPSPLNNNNHIHMNPPTTGGPNSRPPSQQPTEPSAYSTSGNNLSDHTQNGHQNGNMPYTNGIHANLNGQQHNHDHLHAQQPHEQQQNGQQQSFLLNTTTSTNISTSTTSTFNDSFFGPNTHYGFFGQALMTDDASKAYLDSPFTTTGQDMDVECGRSLTNLDAYQPPSSTTLLDLSGNTISSMSTLNSSSPLPPVSTFLFRDNGWWTGMKSPTSIDSIEPSSQQPF